MLKRTIRERKEYLYRKNLEAKERLFYEKKRKIRDALAEGKPIPTELRNEEADLRKEIDLEDEQTAIPRSHIDDEYANATEQDPKILLTTSRDPSQPLTQFAKVNHLPLLGFFSLFLACIGSSGLMLSLLNVTGIEIGLS
ncbi:hypothetical protein Taro_043097 [Colocasia esculenta]|uniref:Uncharacterized protein n=1 Tax=Colocasia esculenta TaxID=4460 RepID=A0A843WZZ4_COLES|nr:hypothetical protein [Colocasia esculenta]